jgi:TonB family protein
LFQPKENETAKRKMEICKMSLKELCTATLFMGLVGIGGASAQSATNTVTGAVTSLITAEQQREIDAAKPNIRLAKTQPVFVSGPQAVFSDAEKQLGHHGKVLVQGLLGVDGKMRYLTVQTSSRVPALDQSALDATAATTFQPAKDEAGRAIAVPIAMPHEFYAYKSSTGYGAREYTCDQFVRDQDWYKTAWPDDPYTSQEFYSMVRGLQIVMAMGSGRSLTQAMASVENNQAFEARWRAAIETCRARPTAKFVEALKPEGDIILRLDGNSRQRRQ